VSDDSLRDLALTASQRDAKVRVGFGGSSLSLIFTQVSALSDELLLKAAPLLDCKSKRSCLKRSVILTDEIVCVNTALHLCHFL
jgi:hypothetical protein